MVESGRDPIDEAATEARRMTVAQLADRYLAAIEKTHRVTARSAAQSSATYFRLSARARRKIFGAATLSRSLTPSPNVARRFRLTGSGT